MISKEDIKGIAREIAIALTNAWNRGSGEEFSKCFTDDAVFVNVYGEILYTRAAIAKGHQFILDNVFKGTTINYSLTDAGQIDTHTILSHNRGSMVIKGVTGGLTMTLVIIKQNDQWLIRALHNTTIVENPFMNHKNI